MSGEERTLSAVRKVEAATLPRPVAVDASETGRAQVSVRRASRIDPLWLLDLDPDRVIDTDELTWNRGAELAFGYSDLVLVPNRSRPAAQVGFVVELKYLKAGATDADVAERLDEADRRGATRWIAAMVVPRHSSPWDSGIAAVAEGDSKAALRRVGL